MQSHADRMAREWLDIFVFLFFEVARRLYGGVINHCPILFVETLCATASSTLYSDSFSQWSSEFAIIIDCLRIKTLVYAHNGCRGIIFEWTVRNDVIYRTSTLIIQIIICYIWIFLWKTSVNLQTLDSRRWSHQYDRLFTARLAALYNWAWLWHDVALAIHPIFRSFATIGRKRRSEFPRIVSYTLYVQNYLSVWHLSILERG